MADREGERRFAAGALRAVAAAVFEAAGCAEAEAATVARHLVEANLTGHDSHGVIRVHLYVGLLRDGMVRPGQHISVVHETDSLAVLDGNQGFGQVIGEEVTDMLVAKARSAGIAMTALRNSGHLGRIGGWAERVAEAGLISLHFVNTTGRGMYVVPYGGTDRRMSLNPVAIAVPQQGGDSLLLDFTTAMCARGKITLARNRGDRMPPGYIVDRDGNPTEDPHEVDAGGAVLPFGGYKGSGLNVIADLFAGALSGGGCTRAGETVLINNMTSIAIDPAPLVDAEWYRAEIERYAAWVKASPPQDADGEVLLPGEPEHRTRAHRMEDGIPVDATTWAQLVEAGESVGLGVAAIERLGAAG